MNLHLSLSQCEHLFAHINKLCLRFSFERADQFSCHWNCFIVFALFAPLSMHSIIVIVNCCVVRSHQFESRFSSCYYLTKLNGTETTATKIRCAFLPCTSKLIRIAFVVVVAVHFVWCDLLGRYLAINYVERLQLSQTDKCQIPKQMKNTFDKWNLTSRNRYSRRGALVWPPTVLVYISCPNNLDACRHTFSYIRSDLLSRCRRTARMLDKQCHM